jgi:hypothetical protein
MSLHEKRLLQIGADCLSPIFDFLNGFDLAKLWCCGDILLSNHLRSLVARFEVEFTPYHDAKFPRLIAHFPRLLHLCIIAKQGEPILSYVDIAIIPKTIQHIDLNFPNDLWYFTRYLVPPSSCPSAEMLDLNLFFPNLKSLTVQHTSAPNVPGDKLHVSLSAFPAGLTELTFLHALQLGTSELCLLPQTLTRLRMSRIKDDIEDLVSAPPKFPPDLLLLGLDRLDNTNIIKYLPRSMESFAVHVFNNLEQLDWSTFPPSLKQLHMSLCGDFVLNRSHINSLPRDLTDLYMRGWGDIDIDDDVWTPGICFPPNLTSCTLPRSPPSFDYRILPSKVKNFPFKIGLPAKSADWINLPRGLTKLYIRCPTNSKDHISLLPSTITSLTWDVTDLSILSLAPFTNLQTLKLWMKADGLDFDSLDRFASTLTSLSIIPIGGALDLKPLNVSKIEPTSFKYDGTLNMADIDKKMFPWTRAMTFVDIAHAIVPEETTLSDLLPNTLTRLSIGGSKGNLRVDLLLDLPLMLTWLKIGDIAGALASKHLKALPPRLTAITLYADTKAQLTLDDLLILPRSMTTLSLPPSELFENSNEAFAKLPSHMPALSSCSFYSPHMPQSSSFFFISQVKKQLLGPPIW